VTFDEVRQFADSEPAQLHDRRLPAVCRRQHVSRLFLAVDVHNDPRLVYAVTATEVGVRQEMGAALEKHFGSAGARNYFLFVRNFNEKLSHARSLVSGV